MFRSKTVPRGARIGREVVHKPESTGVNPGGGKAIRRHQSHAGGTDGRAECGVLASERIVFVPSRQAGRSEGFQQTAFGVIHRLRFMQNRAGLTERRASGDRIQHNNGPRQSLRPHLTTSAIIQRPRRIHRTGRNRCSSRIQILICTDHRSSAVVVDRAICRLNTLLIWSV